MIAEKLESLRSSLSEGVTLVAVSKTKPDEDLMVAYEAWQRIFGENKVQELTGSMSDFQGYPMAYDRPLAKK